MSKRTEKDRTPKEIVVVDDSEFEESPIYEHDPDVVTSRTKNDGPGFGVRNNPVSGFYSFTDIVNMASEAKMGRKE